MRNTLICAVMALLVSMTAFAQEPAAPKAEEGTGILKTEKDRLSYSIGMNIGSGFKAQSIEVDTTLLLRGIQDALSGTAPLMTDEQMRAALTSLQSQIQAKHAEKQAQELAENKKKGDAFLTENKAKEGVMTLASGLQYKVLKEGTGAKPKATDTVTTHYRGTLIDGSEFDSSYSRNEPATFQLNKVIKGWTEALQLMTVGSKWQLFIPSDLAYGERGAADVIGPNETLIFEVELMSIQETPQETPMETPKE